MNARVWKGVFLIWCCMAGSVLGADSPPVAAQSPVSPVMDYESRLETIGAEVDAVRAELEQLVSEVAAGDMGQVFLFLEAPSQFLRTEGVRVAVDDATVFARRLLPPELDVLDKGLPVELVALHLSAGQHRVSLTSAGRAFPEAVTFEVKRASMAAWVATSTKDGIVWREE